MCAITKANNLGHACATPWILKRLGMETYVI